MPEFKYLVVLSILSMALVTAAGWFMAFLIALVLAFSFGYQTLSTAQDAPGNAEIVRASHPGEPFTAPLPLPEPSRDGTSDTDIRDAGDRHGAEQYAVLPVDPLCANQGTDDSANNPLTLRMFLACNRYQTWSIPGPHSGTFYIIDEPPVSQDESRSSFVQRFPGAVPLDESNADERNHQYEAGCRVQLLEHRNATNFRMLSPLVRGRYQLPNTPDPHHQWSEWIDMSGSDLMAMPNPPYRVMAELFDEARAPRSGLDAPDSTRASLAQSGPDFDTKWLGLVNVAFSSADGGLSDCQLYYPQLFYGYWAPIDDEKPNREP